MRMIIFFDLPTITMENRKSYRKFVKYIKRQGFLMMQESVYVKLAINSSLVNLVKEKIKNCIPKKGLIALLVITEKQFSNIEMLLGQSSFDTINTDERLIEI